MEKRLEMKVLFISPVPVEGAGCRFRLHQYFPYLSEQNIRVCLSPFLFSAYFNIVYKEGRIFLKTFYFFISSLRRVYDILRAPFYDIIFVYRESYPVGPPVFEYIFRFLGRPVICDFDDAVFLPNASRANNFIGSWRRPENINKIIGLSSCVIAGNEYLEKHALKFQKNVFVLPTVVDTDRYIPAKKGQRSGSNIVIGWMGTPTTAVYLKPFFPVFRTLNGKYKNISLEVVGSSLEGSGVGDNILLCEWSLEKELEQLQGFDIGIMPMPDNDWTRGKCAFKAILYMSAGIPVVCSPVGVNRKVVRDGVNGFLAATEKEWTEKLSLLIEDAGLRKRMGLAGRQCAERDFSLKVNAPRLAGIFRDVYSNSKKGGKFGRD